MPKAAAGNRGGFLFAACAGSVPNFGSWVWERAQPLYF
jgi:hypothetical protein